MNIRIIILVILACTGCSNTAVLNNEKTVSATFNVTVAESFADELVPEGRIFLFLSKEEKREPRYQLWPLSTKPNHIFAMNIANLSTQTALQLNGASSLITTASFGLSNIPKGQYSLQVLWDNGSGDSQLNAPGNLYSESSIIEVKQDFIESIVLDKIVPPRELKSHPLVQKVRLQSPLLSKFWGRPYFINAAVLLPSSYLEDIQQTYPIRYNVAGYGGRFTRVNRLVDSEKFMQWWMSDDAPQIITVYLDGEGPFGDSYQLDSDNSGPFGTSLINELIPSIENQFRTTGNDKYRFTDGCSTGGWVSLALQLFYPDTFNGSFSYSPDAVDFSAYQLINIYEDKNVFYNEWGNLRPVARDLSGDPMVTMKAFIQNENVLGISNDYRTSGSQFSAHTALYSPKGKDNLPMPLFDPQSGEIDAEVAIAWKKYDLKLYAQKNWPALGPKLEDKIYIWMGDMDNFFLNTALRQFEQFLDTTETPISNAILDFEPMAGHCDNFSDKHVLLQIQQRLDLLQ
ncbi:MAG: S-formylglutathione hydrolase FrmB [Alphaproteobacteria bacterium]